MAKKSPEYDITYPCNAMHPKNIEWWWIIQNWRRLISWHYINDKSANLLSALEKTDPFSMFCWTVFAIFSFLKSKRMVAIAKMRIINTEVIHYIRINSVKLLLSNCKWEDGVFFKPCSYIFNDVITKIHYNK